MIRMIQSCSAGQAVAYFRDSLQQSAYYLNEQERPGQLHGFVAKRLDLEERTTQDAFHALCDNIHPLTSQPLTPRTKENRTVGYDVNFHCPKSISILHALTSDDHILDAFQASVRETMLVIESDAKTRVRKQGQDDDRVTGELVWAEFLHQTARPVAETVPDPHVHCHAFVFNVTWDAVEKIFKAGQFRDIKRDMPYYQARFHKILSDRLIALGYRIRRTNTAFEIVGVPERIIDLFSKRTNEIGRIADTLGVTDPAKLDQLGARTRAKKQKSLTMAQLKQAWREQILALGMTDTDEGGQTIRHEPSVAPPPLTPQDCVEHALGVKFERASVVHDRRILETAYRHSIGNPLVSVDQITDAFAQDTRILHIVDGAKTLCTTQEVLADEQRMVALARQGQGALQPLYQTAPPIALDGEQKEAVSHVLTTTNRVAIIRGRAGTGKTSLMREAIGLITATGHAVTVVAPTAQAARGVLRAEGFDKADTVAQLINSPTLQDGLADGVLWVDEAGLLNTHEMNALLTLAQTHNARLILSGDTRQHASVVRGDALRILSSVAGIKSAEISRIHRQRDPAYRQAVQELSQGNIVSALAALDNMGAIQTLDPVEPFAKLAADYVATLKRGKTALVISPTHQTGEQVTQAIRDQLRQNGRIGETEFVATRLINHNLTQAEKSDCRNYRVGQIVQFNQNGSATIKRGSRWQVAAVSDREVTIKDNGGTVTALPLPLARKFDLYSQTEIGLSTGDTIRITRNGFDLNRKRLNNGQTLTVVGVAPDGTIRLRNAISKVRYTVPNEFGHLAYAHCITSHAAQGKTVDEVFIAQPASTFAATNLKQFYVSVSRARDRVHLYTDDKDELLNHATQVGDRMSALELVRRRRAKRQTAEQVVRQSQPVTAPLQAKPQPVEPVMLRKPVGHAPRP